MTPTVKSLSEIPEKDLGMLVNQVRNMVKNQGYMVVKHDLQSSYDMLSFIDETMVDHVASKLAKTDTKWTRERVKSELFGDFKRDMVFSGKKLVEMGVATNIGQPPEDDYKG
jgi:hypothetical protein